MIWSLDNNIYITDLHNSGSHRYQSYYDWYLRGATLAQWICPAAPGSSLKHTLYVFIIYRICDICRVKRTKINEKEAGNGPFKKDWYFWFNDLFFSSLTFTVDLHFPMQIFTAQPWSEIFPSFRSWTTWRLLRTRLPTHTGVELTW